MWVIRLLLALGVAWGLVEITAAQDDGSPVPAYADIAYNDQTPRQTLDVYLPEESSGPYPTLLLIHGGGFQFGSKRILAPYAGALLDLGYGVVSINYRLAPEYTYPAQVEDAFCAVAWVHAQGATYGLDPDRLVVIGESAGGYLAAMLGAVNESSRYLAECPHGLNGEPARGVVAYYPMTGLAIDDYLFVTRVIYDQYLGLAPDSPDYAARFAEASVATYIDGDELPFLVIHGQADSVVPPADSERLVERLHNVGATVQFLFVPADDHAFISMLDHPAGMQALEAVQVFLESLGL